MKAKILNEDNQKIMINIKDADFETVNSIRRSCMNNVPTMAIEDVQIFSNNSALYDEVLAHRLGLIPLSTDLKTYNKKKDCKCQGAGCARCTVELSLEAKGPGTVYSKDLISSDPKIKPVFENIPIVKLFQDQEVKFIAKANLNDGTYHQKHAPCTAYHQYYPNIKVLKTTKALDDICPRKVFKGGTINNEKLLKCNLCNACAEAFPKKIKIESNDKDMILTVESWGQLKPKEIFNTALENLTADLKEFKKNL